MESEEYEGQSQRLVSTEKRCRRLWTKEHDASHLPASMPGPVAQAQPECKNLHFGLPVAYLGHRAWHHGIASRCRRL